MNSVVSMKLKFYGNLQTSYNYHIEDMTGRYYIIETVYYICLEVTFSGH